jgi:hypothetical protein
MVEPGEAAAGEATEAGGLDLFLAFEERAQG